MSTHIQIFSQNHNGYTNPNSENNPLYIKIVGDDIKLKNNHKNNANNDYINNILKISFNNHEKNTTEFNLSENAEHGDIYQIADDEFGSITAPEWIYSIYLQVQLNRETTSDDWFSIGALNKNMSPLYTHHTGSIQFQHIFYHDGIKPLLTQLTTNNPKAIYRGYGEIIKIS